VRNVTLTGCAQRGCTIDGAIVEDVRVDGLKSSTLLQTWAAAFRHVALRGRVGRWMFSNLVSPLAAPAQQHDFDRANQAFYASTDWALDISEAEFTECDIRGIPAPLIRRDPATQAVVTREKALQGGWERLDLSRTYWPTAIRFLLQQGHADVVLVAPKRSRNFTVLLDGLKMLRDAGVAEL